MLQNLFKIYLLVLHCCLRFTIYCTPEEEIQVCYRKPGQKPLAGKVTDLNGETTVALLLNGYSVPVQLPSKLLFMDREKYYCQL